MKKLLVFLFIGIISLHSHCYAQSELMKIDYQVIKEYVANQSEEYQKLIQRFEVNDSLLTRKDYATIYYGYSFTPNYNASMFDLTDEYQNFRKLAKEGENEQAYAAGKVLLKKNPVSLELLYQLGMLANKLKKDIEEIKIYSKRYAALLTMIPHTGDGRSEETAFKVICVNDEYQLLQVLFNMENMESQSLVNKCDLIEFNKCKYYLGTKMYFDISRSLDYINGLLKK